MSAAQKPTLRSGDGLVLAAVLAVAVAVRWVHLDTIPGNLMLDEADNAQNAYLILVGRGTGVAGLDWSHAPLFSMYLLAACIAAFGNSVAGIRAMPVLLSTLSLVPFFLIARQQVSRLAAGCATLLLATSLWYVHFSRTAWINMTAPLFALGAVYFLTRALAQRRWRDYLLCAACITLGVYGYPAGLSLPVAIAAACPVAVLRDPAQWKRTVAGFALALGLAGVLFAPHLWVASHSEDSSRMSSVSILAQREYLGETDLATIVLQQIGRNVAGFILLDPDQMGRGLWAHYLPPGRTLLDHGTGVLFWIGLIAGARRWRQTFLWWLLLLVPILTVQVLSMATPDAGRGLIVAPFMYLFVALGIESTQRLRGPVPAALAAALVLAVVVVLAVMNLRQYFEWIQTPQALGERHPAVELSEFRAWSRLQRGDLAAGGRGFAVHDWRERIDNDGCKNGTLQGAVCRRTGPLASRRRAAVQNRAFTTPTVRAIASPVAAAASATTQHDPAQVQRWVRVSAGESVAQRDQARRRDLARVAGALQQLRDRGGYPKTDGRLESLCFYPDDAACALHTLLDPIPADPRGMGNGYWYWSDGAAYALYAVLEGEASAAERCAERPAHIEVKGDVICVRRSSAPASAD